MRRLVCEYYDGFSFGDFMRQLPGAARHGDRSADRRSVQRSRRQGLGADGVDVSARQGADSRLERRARSLDDAPQKANELILPEAIRP